MGGRGRRESRRRGPGPSRRFRGAGPRGVGAGPGRLGGRRRRPRGARDARHDDGGAWQGRGDTCRGDRGTWQRSRGTWQRPRCAWHRRVGAWHGSRRGWHGPMRACHGPMRACHGPMRAWHGPMYACHSRCVTRTSVRDIHIQNAHRALARAPGPIARPEPVQNPTGTSSRAVGGRAAWPSRPAAGRRRISAVARTTGGRPSSEPGRPRRRAVKSPGRPAGGRAFGSWRRVGERLRMASIDGAARRRPRLFRRARSPPTELRSDRPRAAGTVPAAGPVLLALHSASRTMHDRAQRETRSCVSMEAGRLLEH